jgi:hypothetical protein
MRSPLCRWSIRLICTAFAELICRIQGYC